MSIGELRTLPVRNNPDLPAIPGDVLRLVVAVFDSKASGSPANIRFDYMDTVFAGAGLAADVIAFPAAFQTAIEATLKACLAATAVITSYTCMAVSRNDVRNASLAATTAGTAGVNALPSNAAAVIQRGTVVKGQHGRGRLSLPFIPDTFTTPATATDVINATGRTAYGNFIVAAFGTTVAAATITVNGHTYFPCISQTPPKGPNLVTKAQFVYAGYCLLDGKIGTIRNRARRRR